MIYNAWTLAGFSHTLASLTFVTLSAKHTGEDTQFYINISLGLKLFISNYVVMMVKNS